MPRANISFQHADAKAIFTFPQRLQQQELQQEQQQQQQETDNVQEQAEGLARHEKAPQGPPASVLETFDSFVFGDFKTPVRTVGTPKAKPALPRGPRHSSRSSCNKSMRIEGSNSSNSSSSSRSWAAACTAAAATEQSVSNSKHAASLVAEAELTPGVRVSLDWLAEAERRRCLSSAEVAASFRCPSCSRFTMEFRSGRYGMFLGCSNYPECSGKISGAKIERWRTCLGAEKTPGFRLVFEMETPDSFRLHAAGCPETGELLQEAIRRILQSASRIYTAQQQQQQQQKQQQQKQQQQQERNRSGEEEKTDIPGLLRPLSWLPRGDRMRDPTLRLQFCSAALAHARRAAKSAAGEDVSAAAGDGLLLRSSSACSLMENSTDGGGGMGPLQFVDWTAGALCAPADGLEYKDGCVFRLCAYPYILRAATATCGWAHCVAIPMLTLRFFRDYWAPGCFLVTSKERACRVAWWLLPRRLRSRLLAFQWEGIAYALQRGGRVIIGDEMGLGKTAQAIACIAVYRQFPCLIVVPASMRLAWADALEEWLPEYSAPPMLHVVFASGDRPAPEDAHHICLSSFEMASRLYDSLKVAQYKFVIVDEAHKLRGPSVLRPSPCIPTEAAAAAAADVAAEKAADDAAAGPVGPCSEHEDVSTQKPNSQTMSRGGLSKKWLRLPPTIGQDLNKKVLDLVRGSQHALLLSGTPSVRLPADLFPLVDALLTPLEQHEAMARREQQLQQWRDLEATATAAAAAEDAVQGQDSDRPSETSAAVRSSTAAEIVRSPWEFATEAWRAAAAAAAGWNGEREAFGNAWQSTSSSVLEANKNEMFGAFANGRVAIRRVGNILREERLQFAEEYCSSSRAFGSWRRFGVSFRSWELHLLLTKAVLLRRRKTLRPLPAGLPQQGASGQPSMLDAKDETYRAIPSHAEIGAASAWRGQSLDTGVASSTALATPLWRASTPTQTSPVASDIEDVRGGPDPGLGLHAPVEATVEGVDPPPACSKRLCTPSDAERLITGLPWAAKSSDECNALVLPPCTRIVQLLLLHRNNKLLTAIGEGLLLQRQAFSSLLHEARRAAATEGPIGDSSSSDDALRGGGPSQFADCVDIAADLIRRPPPTAAERAGLCKVPAAAQWLYEKFFRGSQVSMKDEETEEGPPKVIVFAHHRRVLDALAARLRELRLGCIDSGEPGVFWSRKNQGFVRIDGSVAEEERRRRKRLFLTDPKCNLALISITASSHGLDFSDASVCVFLELLPQQHELLQAEARLHRRGQRRVVTTFFLLSRCSPAAATTRDVSSSGVLPLRAASEAQHRAESYNYSFGEDDFGENASTSPLRRSTRQRPGTAYLLAAKQASLQLGFRTELKHCCMRLQREAETLDEAAWRRLLQQTALMQQTLDGPLSTSSQLGADVQQLQQQIDPCSSRIASEDAASSYNAGQQRQQQQQQQQPQSQDIIMEAAACASTPQHSASITKGAQSKAATKCPSPSRQQPQETLRASLSSYISPCALENFQFRVSRFTQRLHAFDGDKGRPLGVSFSPTELETGTPTDSIVQEQQLQKLQHAAAESPLDQLAATVLVSARRYWRLFCLLSSFEQRRFREALLTVQQLQAYVHRRHGAQQDCNKGTPHSGSHLLDNECLKVTSPVHFITPHFPQQLAKKDSRQTDAAPGVLPPRHTTDPVLLLQLAKQQQRLEHQQLCHLLGDEASSERHLEKLPACNTEGSWSIKDSDNSMLFHETADSFGTVSSRYFCSPPATPPPGAIALENPASQERRQELGSNDPVSSSGNTSERRPFILIPVITYNARAAPQRQGPVSRHMQPFCLERRTILCVSCLKPISTVSTTRVFLSLGETEDPCSISPLPCQREKAQSLVVSQLARRSMSADMAYTTQQQAGNYAQATAHFAERADPHKLSSGILQRSTGSSQVHGTQRWNLATDGTQGCFIRCTEQDLTCSGRCWDAYAARRQRQALRRQVERHDRGVCSQCGLDCGEMLAALKVLHAAGNPQWRLEEEIARVAPSFRPWPSLIRRLASNLTAGCAWEADHRKPVKEGGGLATVYGVQTLCRGCHMEKTIEERNQRQKRRG